MFKVNAGQITLLPIPIMPRMTPRYFMSRE